MHSYFPNSSATESEARTIALRKLDDHQYGGSAQVHKLQSYARPPGVALQILGKEMINIHWQGRFGNQLFQYSFGRILNLRSGRAVCFPSKFAIDLWTPVNTPGTVYNGPVFKYQISQSGFDWTVLEREQPLAVCGYFEDYRYYAPYQDQIRSWLPAPILPVCDPDEIVVHMRRTDFSHTVVAGTGPHRRQSTPMRAPLNLLADAVLSFGKRPRVRIVTDDYGDDMVIAFARRFDAVIARGSPKTDFLTLCAAKNVVMSPSTFSWWATFLGNPRRVVCPLWKNCSWTIGGEGHPDFPRPMITDDPRFEYPIGYNDCRYLLK